MKKLLLFCCCALLIFNCKEKQNEQLEKKQQEKKQEEKESTNLNFSHNEYRLWCGIFEADSVNYENEGNWSIRNRITLVIKSFDNNNTIEGYSVTAGNIRPFKGDIIMTGKSIYVIANEPGDHKYDGTFKFNISDNQDSIYGIWISKRKDLPVLSRKFSLKKTEFNYNPNNILTPINNVYDDDDFDDEGNVDWVNSKKSKIDDMDEEEYFSYVNRVASNQIYKINGSTQKLTEKQLKNLHKLDLEIIRNTIYARHGYTFANRGARQFFDNVDWYVPLFVSVENKLTPLEKENIAILKRFEKYATDNYQQFGR
ncbi:YARHG domain-containing protein [Chishuiella sp.]|uniref:YARHG domain-containing protein n=1 Tax=Chishuiella sp. TaxID=1969467 RepID=UPI0028A6E36B|nr:YARHG domain-containing protein [Chishuiella sp.]